MVVCDFRGEVAGDFIWACRTSWPTRSLSSRSFSSSAELRRLRTSGDADSIPNMDRKKKKKRNEVINVSKIWMKLKGELQENQKAGLELICTMEPAPLLPLRQTLNSSSFSFRPPNCSAQIVACNHFLTWRHRLSDNTASPNLYGIRAGVQILWTCLWLRHKVGEEAM